MADNLDYIDSFIEELASGLDAGYRDVRIGVTTTDVSHPMCPGHRNNGELIVNSCAANKNDYKSTGDDGPIGDHFGYACADHCSSSLNLQPSLLGNWVDFPGGVAHLPAESTAEQTLRCLIPVGFNGCATESPLEAAYLAIEGSSDPDSPHAGFIREDALLVVFDISDEVDCSAKSELAEDFGGDSPHFDCWSIAGSCDESPPNSNSSSCTILEEPIRDPGPLHPIRRYTNQYENLRDAKSEYSSGLFVFAAGGFSPGNQSPNWCEDEDEGTITSEPSVRTAAIIDRILPLGR